MNGIFRHRFTIIGDWAAMISGIFLAVLSVFLLNVDGAMTASDRIIFGLMIPLGIVGTLFGLLGLRQTRRIFLRVEEDRIQGYTPYRGKIDCAMADVDRVAWGGAGLTITLKNGKSYNFVNLVNNDALGELIRSKTFVPQQVSMDRETLARAILSQRKKVRRRGIGALVSLLAIFPPILLAAYLTDGRELAGFTGEDWRIFAILGCVVLAGFAAFFLLLRSWVRANGKYERLLGAIPTE